MKQNFCDVTCLISCKDIKMYFFSDVNLKNFIYNHDLDPHLYVFITYQAFGGTVGIAWRGVVCRSNSGTVYGEPAKAFKASINGFYFGDEQYTGGVIYN